ncbi:MAG: hypothetical protein AB1568_10825 [Thermodesulfobacteriota bacterium]
MQNDVPGLSKRFATVAATAQLFQKIASIRMITGIVVGEGVATAVYRGEGVVTIFGSTPLTNFVSKQFFAGSKKCFHVQAGRQSGTAPVFAGPNHPCQKKTKFTIIYGCDTDGLACSVLLSHSRIH